jgi:hypothetical protein
VQEVAEKCTFDNLKKNRMDPSALFNVGVESSLYRKGKYIEFLIGYSIPYALVCYFLSSITIKFTSWLPMVGGSLRGFRLPPPLKLVAIISLKYC